LATGYKVSDYFAPMEIYDKNGRSELEKWKQDGPKLYLGISNNDLPNLFVLYGPNTVRLIELEQPIKNYNNNIT